MGFNQSKPSEEDQSLSQESDNDQQELMDSTKENREEAIVQPTAKDLGIDVMKELNIKSVEIKNEKIRFDQLLNIYSYLVRKNLEFSNIIGHNEGTKHSLKLLDKRRKVYQKILETKEADQKADLEEDYKLYNLKILAEQSDHMNAVLECMTENIENFTDELYQKSLTLYKMNRMMNDQIEQEAKRIRKHHRSLQLKHIVHDSEKLNRIKTAELLKWREDRRLEVLSILSNPFKSQVTDQGETVVELSLEKAKIEDAMFCEHHEINNWMLEKAAEEYEMLKPEEEIEMSRDALVILNQF